MMNLPVSYFNLKPASLLPQSEEKIIKTWLPTERYGGGKCSPQYFPIKGESAELPSWI